MIEVTDGFESVRVSVESDPEPGERVTIAFALSAPVLGQGDVKVSYPLPDKGSRREIQGTPDYTHTTALPGGGWLHHYRLSHWNPAKPAVVSSPTPSPPAGPSPS